MLVDISLPQRVVQALVEELGLDYIEGGRLLLELEQFHVARAAQHLLAEEPLCLLAQRLQDVRHDTACGVALAGLVMPLKRCEYLQEGVQHVLFRISR